MHVGTSLVQIVHPQGFDLWMSKNHWVSSYPSNTPVLKLILPSFVVDVLIWFFDVCSLIWHGMPPCSFNLTSGLARRNISHSGRWTFSAVSSECKLCFLIVLLPICLSRHVFTIPTWYFNMRQQHVVLLLCFFSQHTPSLFKIDLLSFSNHHLKPDASEWQKASEADSFDGGNWPLGVILPYHCASNSKFGCIFY